MGQNQSKLPFVVWPEDEAAQKVALEKSPQLAAFKVYRESIRDHKFTPGYHFCAPDGKLNDPNGLCFYNGKYHLFYQQYPPADPRQHWGHAISEDLVHWADLPTAIYPDPERAVYSGNTLVEEDRVIAMYHGLDCGNMVAVSKDPLLLNWEKLTGNPVITWDPGKPYGVFDPHLRKEADGYYSLSGVAKHTPFGRRMTEQQFYSRDLVHWTWIGELMEENPYLSVGEDGACPYFIPMKDDRYLLFHFSHHSGPHILSGIYDPITHKFRPDHYLRPTSQGPGNGTLHAPCAISDGNGGAYCIFNCTDGRTPDGEYPRDGVMSMMYHVTLGEDNEPVISPLPQYDTLHKKLLYAGSLTAEPGQRLEVPARGKSLDIQMTVQMAEARGFELEVLTSAQERTVIRFAERRGGWKACGMVTVDTTHSSLDPLQIGKAPEIMELPLMGEDRKLDMRILVDNCTMEVFCQGRLAFNMAYPTLPESDGIFLSAIGGRVCWEKIQVWSMKQIY